MLFFTLAAVAFQSADWGWVSGGTCIGCSSSVCEMWTWSDYLRLFGPWTRAMGLRPGGMSLSPYVGSGIMSM